MWDAEPSQGKPAVTNKTETAYANTSWFNETNKRAIKRIEETIPEISL